MPAATQSRRHQRPASRRQAAAPQLDPQPIDRRRWEDLQLGISPEELAARENVRLPTILKSRDTMRSYLARYSQTAADTEVRRLFVQALPDAARVFAEGMAATTTITRQVVRERHNPRTDEMEEYVDTETDVVPDHAMRAKFLTELTKLNQSIQPKTPLVSVDARSQTNNLHQLGAPVSGGALSFESITRQIRAERGLSLGAGEPLPAAAAATLAPIEVDYELVEELAEDILDDDIIESAAEASQPS